MRRQYFDYRPRPQFRAFHRRKERFACLVTHRRAGKTVACIHELQRRAIESTKKHPRFAYLSPLLKHNTVGAMQFRVAGAARPRRVALLSPPRLLYDLISPREERRGHIEPEGLRGLQVDHQLVSDRCLHGEVGRLLASEDAIHVFRSSPNWIVRVRPVANHATICGVVAERVNCRQLVA